MTMNRSKSARSDGSLAPLLLNPVVWGFAGFLGLANILLLILGRDGLPVSLAGESGFSNITLFVSTGFFYAVILGVVHLVTRKRERPDFTARTPVKSVARLETLWLWVYALIALAVLGLGYGIGLHLPGTIFQPDARLSVSYTLIWAGVNFVLFAAIPYGVFRAQGYSNAELGLRSLNLRADVLLIVTVLIAESIGEWFGIPDGFRFFSLTPSQILVGGSVTVLLHLIGTGIPIMIFIQAILVPRYFKLTGSVTTSVILGGLSYATFHLFEFWAVYGSLEAAVVSLVFVYLQFTGAGMVKAFMTLRSGNSWTHLWGYHVIAPHLWMDAVLIITAFGIR